MNKTHEYLEISELIARKLSDTASENDLLKLKKWIEANKENKAIYDKYIENKDINRIKNEFEDISSGRVWNNISKQLFNKSKSQLILNNVIWKVAASIVFIVLLGGGNLLC